LWFSPVAAAGSDAAAPPAQDGDMQLQVALDAGEQSGTATATVRIHAGREVVWGLITSCAESLRLVPGMAVCEVLETAPDLSWQRIHQVISYSWFVPKVSYDIRAAYDRPSRVSVERVAGDLRILRGSWVLDVQGADTIAHYSVALEPGFWVPQWLVRSVLRHDLPKMLQALRARAEENPVRLP
jgi:hypothetical protein